MNGSGAGRKSCDKTRRIGKRGEIPPRPRHCKRLIPQMGISAEKTTVNG